METKFLVKSPVILCSPGDTVAWAADQMVEQGRGSVLIMDEDRIVGIFTERDVLSRIVAGRRDPESTLLAEVMTPDVITMDENIQVDKALHVMLSNKCRHLPLVDAEGRPAGMVSLRRALRFRMENLDRECSTLIAYFGADGPGG